MPNRYYDRKKKIQSSVWRVRNHYYDWKKKKDTVVCLAGARSLLQLEKNKIQLSVRRVRDRYYDRKKKSSSRLSGGCAIIITTGKKKDTVVCLAGARSLLRPEKKKIQSSVWRVRDRYYDQKKKIVVCLVGCAVVSVFGSSGK